MHTFSNICNTFIRTCNLEVHEVLFIHYRTCVLILKQFGNFCVILKACDARKTYPDDIFAQFLLMCIFQYGNSKQYWRHMWKMRPNYFLTKFLLQSNLQCLMIHSIYRVTGIVKYFNYYFKLVDSILTFLLHPI